MKELLVKAKLDKSKPMKPLMLANYTLSAFASELFHNPTLYRRIFSAL